MKNKIKIIACEIKQEDISRLKSSSADILAASPISIEQLEKNGIKFLTLNDFIGQKEFYNELHALSLSYDIFIHNCDLLGKAEIGIDNLFSSNNFRIFHRMSHLMFSHILIRKIEEEYNLIEVFRNEENQERININHDFTSLHLPIEKLTGTEGLMNCLRIGLEVNRYSEFYFSKDRRVCSIKNYPIHLFFKAIPQNLIFLCSRFFNSLEKYTQKSKKITHKFVATEMLYDIERINDSLPSFQIVPIRTRAINALKTADSSVNDEFITEIENLSKAFFEMKMPKFSGIMIEIFRNLSKIILPNVPILRKEIRKIMQTEKPKAILLPSGSADILDHTICQIGIEENLDIYSFKHTGIEHVFFIPQILDKYRDYNLDLNRIQLVHTFDEVDIFKGSKRVKPIVLGNLKKKNKRKKGDRSGILFCSGIQDASAFHSHYVNLSDKERHIWNKRLISAIESNNLRLDIKLHPVAWEDSWKYFTELIKHSKNKSLRLIAGGSAEKSFHNYDLLILDMVPTQVLSSALANEMNIILFKQNDFLFRERNFIDLDSRVHIVNNYDDLNEALSLYKNNLLRNKSNQYFTKKYLNQSSQFIDILNSQNKASPI